MKTRILKTRRRTNVGGEYVDAGTVLARIQTDAPIESVLMLLSQGLLDETVEGELGADVANGGESSADDSVEDSPAGILPPPAADEAGAADLVPEDVQAPSAPAEPDVDRESIPGDTLLKDAGMVEGLYSRLDKNGIKTVEELRRFVESGGDLVELEDIGQTYAKRILGWLDNH